MANQEKVSPNDILKAAGADKPVTEGTFLQRTGLLLAGFVGGISAIVILALIGKWIFYAPKLPAIPSNADQATVKAMLDNYRALQQIALEPFTTLFDSIVVKVLLPVFTSILGYIFGSRGSDKTER
jgi:hypothetical protein